ncbi:collectin-12-like [Dreissena polymorpha]|uniref:C-type lectin domain-containing protein n=1 Tax=Dreissena polymorpha TaxID=45954 RepID=A0A9D4I3T6_DREPO|nr:collectin-12-like [Dreissena polymorpha]KAH3741521.1 hypothetical protein DPMN_048246 [Dreissena polymorpha]
MEIKVCVIFVSLVIGVNCNQRNVQFAEDTALSGFKCSATEQIGDVVLTQTTQMCTSVCASTDGCKSVFYKHSECVRCRSRYRKAGDARLMPMAGSVSYRTVVRCNPGWLSLLDSCYLWNSSTIMTFYKTKDYCSSLGAHVLYIDSAEEKDVASNFLPEIAVSDRKAWIGIQLKNKTWISSINGKLVAYFNWASGEPENFGEDCAITLGPDLWRWGDTMCTGLRHVVCEKDM